MTKMRCKVTVETDTDIIELEYPASWTFTEICGSVNKTMEKHCSDFSRHKPFSTKPQKAKA